MIESPYKIYNQAIEEIDSYSTTWKVNLNKNFPLILKAQNYQKLWLMENPARTTYLDYYPITSIINVYLRFSAEDTTEIAIMWLQQHTDLDESTTYISYLGNIIIIDGHFIVINFVVEKSNHCKVIETEEIIQSTKAVRKIVCL